MTLYYRISHDDGNANKLEEEPQSSEWDSSCMFLKIENNDLYEMEEDGEWRLIG